MLSVRPTSVCAPHSVRCVQLKEHMRLSATPNRGSKTLVGASSRVRNANSRRNTVLTCAAANEEDSSAGGMFGSLMKGVFGGGDKKGSAAASQPPPSQSTSLAGKEEDIKRLRQQLVKGFGSAQKPNAAKAIKRGQELYGTGEYEDAKFMFQQALLLPTGKEGVFGGGTDRQDFDSSAYYNIACCEVQLGQVDAALSSAESCINAGFTRFDAMQEDEDLKPLFAAHSARMSELIIQGMTQIRLPGMK